ncbi:efflux RND transporter periplasmic adaptor subunit [Daejeonella lutea]|uniref:HlyD family secretion protein n=1 Tax=Daejeonella lutea TaxID=572036 RepID=A0A1T5BRD4_9SPHI|nr:HlyD family efflux transporter periplasmic adaptor subunit [Daejeonella lutea]SKB49725.1 HlyD family secretion protein [Daejeonella lutea]
MDTELSADFKRKALFRKWLIAGSIIIAMTIAFFGFRSLIEPSIERSKITIETTEVGTIEATIPASGVIVPEYEFLITSPINAKIEQVLHSAGEAVQMGESILKLNKETTQINYDKLLDEQEVNRNKINQLRLSLERTLNDLQTQYSIKEMRIQSLESALEHERSLLKIGGGTAERVKQAVLNLDIAKIELKQLKNQISNQQKTMQADLRSLGLQMSIQNKSISESDRKLNQAEVRSPANGIITWVSSQIGSEVSEGSEIAKIADLRSFKVEGSISDAYASQLRNGGWVIIRINDTDLRGRISSIQPAVENGTVKFFVNLDKKDHPLLRSNLKTEIFIVTSVKNQVLRLKNGSAFDGSAHQKLFVVNGNQASSRVVTVGESNFDYIEIRSGLKAGDKVIVTDMKDFENQDKVEIKD